MYAAEQIICVHVCLCVCVWVDIERTIYMYQYDANVYVTMHTMALGSNFFLYISKNL